MESIPALDDPLGSLFTGKRRWPRVPCSRPARIEGAAATYNGHVIDISKGGIQYAIEDEGFNPAGEDGLRAVERAFPDGPILVFALEGLRMRAQVVRITAHHDRWVALGCAFDKPLTDAQAALLGARIARVKHPEAHQDELRYEGRPNRPLSLLVFAEGSAVAGPSCLCEVQRAGEQVIEGRVVAPTSEPLRLAEILTAHALDVALAEGTRRLWEGSAHLIEIRAAPPPGRTVVRVLCGGDLPPAVIQTFAK